MHRMMNEERSEQMAEPILSGYLSNLGKYTEGRPAGEWAILSLAAIERLIRMADDEAFAVAATAALDAVFGEKGGKDA